MTQTRTILWLVLLLVGSAPAAPAPGEDMDYGPFLAGSLDRDKVVSEKHSKESTEQNGPHPNALAAKAVVVKLGWEAAVAFDTDLLRYAAGWTNGYLDLGKTHLTTPKGSTPLAPKGRVLFETPAVPGGSPDGSFADPRRHGFGPLPKSHGRYKGLHVSGDRVVFSYQLGDCDVLDTPHFGEWADRRPLFWRTIRLGPTRTPLALLLFEQGDGKEPAAVTAGAFNLPPGVTLAREGRRHVLKVEPSETERTVSVFVGPRAQGHQSATAPRPRDGRDPFTMLGGGAAPRYPLPVKTRGKVGTGDGAYLIDTLTLPDDNPANAWIRPSGLDFFSDGRLAVSTLNGDVWVVSGIDASLEKLSWRRYATGLYEPLGLRVVNDVVYVLARDQITRLHDLNDDGEADFYENFNNEAPASANYHGFAFDLDVDSKGNFYYTRAGQRMHSTLPMHGVMLRVSADGSKAEPIAAGLRAANGLCIGPGDFITVADNQGNWTPSSRINVIRQGGFYGWMPHVAAAGGGPRTDYDPPLCWIPVSVDNSGGSQVWATDRRFGPLAGRMFHTSYGRATLMLTMIQKLGDDTYNGGVIRMPFRFDSGVMRGRVNPRDGHLYLCGLRGWQTDGTRDGTLVRVRHTGKPLYMPTDFRAVPGGLELTFSQPLDPETAEDVGSYGIEQWNYKWSKEYSSPEFSVKEPTKQGRDEVEVESAKLLPDKKTVRLSIPEIKPVMQMQISVDVDTADGKNIKDTMWVTINAVPAGERE